MNTGSVMTAGVFYFVWKEPRLTTGRFITLNEVPRLASVLIMFLRAGRQGFRLEIILHEIIRYLVRVATFEIRRVVSAAATLIDGESRIGAERPRAIDYAIRDMRCQDRAWRNPLLDPTLKIGK